MKLHYSIWSETLADGTVRWYGRKSFSRFTWHNTYGDSFVLRVLSWCLVMTLAILALSEDEYRAQTQWTASTLAKVHDWCEKDAAEVIDRMRAIRKQKRTETVVSRTAVQTLTIVSPLDQGT